MNVTYIYHSGFCVELEQTVLLFDFYKGTLPAIDPGKRVYVFVSHRHPDHFKPRVFEVLLQYPDAHFFLSDDIRLSDAWLQRISYHQKPLSDVVTVVHPDKTIAYDGLTIETFTSTDEGVAFVVSAEGKQIYHAGDLNWWHWDGEPEEDNRVMGERYRAEIDKLAGRHFDLAFVPLDPRLEDCFGFGLDYFLAKTDPEAVFPMHMWEKYDWIDRYLSGAAGAAPGCEEAKNKLSVIRRILSKNETFVTGEGA